MKSKDFGILLFIIFPIFNITIAQISDELQQSLDFITRHNQSNLLQNETEHLLRLFIATDRISGALNDLNSSVLDLTRRIENTSPRSDHSVLSIQVNAILSQFNALNNQIQAVINQGNQLREAYNIRNFQLSTLNNRLSSSRGTLLVCNRYYFKFLIFYFKRLFF